MMHHSETTNRVLANVFGVFGDLTSTGAEILGQHRKQGLQLQ